MLKLVAGLALVMSGASAWAASTDFGIRTLSNEASVARVQPVARGSVTWGPRVDLRSVAGIGSQWGRVTSTYRSPAHNRRVGGVRNSFHLIGRAIDIARRPGVTHAQIAAAYRNAGYRLIESLDEGDHSHIAFGTGAAPALLSASVSGSVFKPSQQRPAATQWRVVTAANAVLK
jgi:hypothetical protein